MMLLPPGRVHISEAAVDAALRCPVIQVDVHFRMTERTATSVTGNLKKRRMKKVSWSRVLGSM